MTATLIGLPLPLPLPSSGPKSLKEGRSFPIGLASTRQPLRILEQCASGGVICYRAITRRVRSGMRTLS
jgi:hypothetical protein